MGACGVRRRTGTPAPIIVAACAPGTATAAWWRRRRGPVVCCLVAAAARLRHEPQRRKQLLFGQWQPDQHADALGSGQHEPGRRAAGAAERHDVPAGAGGLVDLK